MHLLLQPAASTTDIHFSLSSLFGEEPHTVFSSHSHLPSWLPGAIYRRTCRSWWTPPKASATRCCFWIFLADFQTAGSEIDQKQPSKTVKGACSLVIVRKIIYLFYVTWLQMKMLQLTGHTFLLLSSTLCFGVFFCSWVLQKLKGTTLIILSTEVAFGNLLLNLSLVNPTLFF